MESEAGEEEENDEEESAGQEREADSKGVRLVDRVGLVGRKNWEPRGRGGFKKGAGR